MMWWTKRRRWFLHRGQLVPTGRWILPSSCSDKIIRLACFPSSLKINLGHLLDARGYQQLMLGRNKGKFQNGCLDDYITIRIGKNVSIFKDSGTFSRESLLSNKTFWLFLDVMKAWCRITPVNDNTWMVKWGSNSSELFFFWFHRYQGFP